MQKQIVITVPLDPNKGVKVETEGFSGTGCQAATRAIEEALGRTAQEELTEEFYKTETQDQQQIQ